MLKTKKFLSIALGLALGLVSLTGYAADEKFSMKEVKVQNPTTVVATFSKDLYAEGSNMFEFKLSQKDTKAEVKVSNLTLSGTTSVVLTTWADLAMDKEYELVAVFVSDKTGNVIENGVDGMLSFVPNNVLASATDAAASATPVETPVDSAMPTSDLTSTWTAEPQDLNAASDATSLNAASASGETLSGAAVVANSAEALPKTGPQEVLVVILALILGLGVFVARRKA